MGKDPENVEYRKVTHVQFDMDGLLLDTEDIYESVFADISAQYGKTLSAQVRLKILGTTTYRSCETCVKDLELPISIDNFMKQFFILSKERLQNVKFMPGAERLIRHLHAHHIPICVATSSDEDSVKFKTKNHREAFELFEHIVMGSTDPEVEEGKPAPDIFLVAASRFIDQPTPEDVSILSLHKSIQIYFNYFPSTKVSCF